VLLPQSERQLGDIRRNPATARFTEQLARSCLVLGGIII
jgi:hypothetical protein